MIRVNINKEKETVLFSTIIKVDDKLLELYVEKYLYYQKPNQLNEPTFKDTFYWSEECYTKKELNHLSYNRIVETNYHKFNTDKYEIQWNHLSKCQHRITGAFGVVKSHLNGTDKFPEQLGVFWISGANHGIYGTHPYWNDREDIIV